jgi:uncharacterized protein YaiL (DUF2058 family)
MTQEALMNSSLKDQLLKAGFVDKKQARQAEIETRQQQKQANKARKSGQPVEPTSAQIAAENMKREKEEQAHRSRELNRARDDERSRKGLLAEMKRLVRSSAIPHGKGEIRYNFVKGTRIKRLYVDRKQQTELAAGRFAIVEWDGAFYVVPTVTAEKVRERAPEIFVYIAEPQPTDPDDPYAAFPIPDDLEW